MIRNFTADYICPINTEPLKNGVVSVNEHGEIVGVFQRGSSELEGKSVEKLTGIIVPGFVNSHCHLELSFLHGQIPRNQGLVNFVKHVIQTRKDKPAEASDITAAMEKADREMRENGIVAVGDISNTDVSAELKRTSSIFYHTYIELLGFSPDVAADVFQKGLDLMARFRQLPASLVPHAPYSVSKELFRLIRKQCQKTQNLLSMHNQETEDENKFFRYKRGGFVDLYQSMNQNIDFFKPQARNSIQTVVPLLDLDTPVLMVHNTYTSLKDIYFARRFGRKITWCFCPNANLYIEGRLPKIDMFLFGPFDITLGTDSLGSNDKLCILSEMKVIQEYYPKIPFTDVLKWATLNGARFLGIDSNFGSIEIGKRPGLNLISNTQGLKLTPESTVMPLL